MIPVSNTTNANNFSANVSRVSTANQPQADRGRARVLEQNVENQQLSQQSKQRLDIDAQAIAAVEQERETRQQAEQQQASASSEKNSSQSFTLIEQQDEQGLSQENQQAQVIRVNNSARNTQFDQTPEQNQTAIDTYQGVNNLARRESVQQLFGVDVFA